MNINLNMKGGERMLFITIFTIEVLALGLMVARS